MLKIENGFIILLLVFQLVTESSSTFDLINYKISANNGQRKQCRLSQLEFPCSFRQKSYPPPNNVNKLQPGDIDIIAALGDSTIGATGADAPNIFHAREQYRGISFAMGAKESWRTVTTLPNMLKVFNPYIAGGSVVTGDEFAKGSNLNLASPGATSVTLIEQARSLIKILSNRRDKHKWKLVTILMGHNDICTHPCNTTYTAFDASPRPYMKRIAQALDLLRDNLPNTFVNFLPVLDVTITLDMYDKHPFCHLGHAWVCPCLYGGFGGTPLSRGEMQKLLSGYMQEMYKLINSGRYEKDDFTVVIQPAFTNLSLFYKPRKDYGRRPDIDYSYFAPDCLHPSQKLHALMARALWNNMLQPVGHKTTGWTKDPPLLCPTQESPYIRTRLNSEKVNMTKMSSDYSSYMRSVRQYKIGCYM